ncbi:uncharacterized protein J8A68_005271, partial [[Candida] subhashii]
MILLIGISTVMVCTAILWCFRKLKYTSRLAQTKKHLPIVEFPDDILEEIFKYLETDEVIQINMVCKRLNSVADNALWHSIFVSSPLVNYLTVGGPWVYYRRVPELIFMEMLRSGKLKTNLLKRLVFAFSWSFSFDWFQDLVTKLPGCSIAINSVDYILGQKLDNFNATKRGYWWKQLGHLDISFRDHIIDGFPEPNIIKSLRIYSADQDFFDNWLPRMTSLESLFIRLLKNVNVDRKITIKNLDIGYMDDDCDCT